MRWPQRLLLLLVVPLFSSQTLSASAEFTHCTVCHGSLAQGNASILAPALTGIEPWYLAEALAAYRAGQRGQAASLDLPALEMRIAARAIPAEQDSSILQFLDQLGRQPCGQP
ncbi:MAG: c-type cytochrome [Proteobacteria bacterium]|nr:c-type cytochrome [Pseudomonadota bacterium]